MKRFSVAVLLGVCLFAVVPRAQDLVGGWKGEIASARPVVIIIDFDAGLASFSGGAVAPLTRHPNATDPLLVEFDIVAGTRTFQFSGRRNDSTIAGVFSGPTDSFPLSLTRLPDDAPRLAAASLSRYPLPPESLSYGKEIDQARAAVAELVKAKHMPGLSIAVAVSGSTVWSEGFGYADLEQHVAVTPLTRFRLGSLSKVLTAAGVARLVEEGMLDLDAPIQRYVPTFPQKPWPITTRQLAGHLAGIRHYRPKDFTGPLKGAPAFDSVTKSLTLFQDDPLLFEPGTNYEYSSYGWNLIAAVIEGASRREFLTYMQRAVFEPLGLRHIVADDVTSIIPDRTRFYERNAQGAFIHAPYVDVSYKWASGGFVSNAEDLVRFGSAHLQQGFLRQTTLDLLFTSQRLRSGKETGVGIGWRTGIDQQGRRILHHGGTIEGGRTILMMYPDSKVVVAMLANALVDFGEQEAQTIASLFIR